ncbi:hypothetical protein [Rhodopirellula europaea]|uniref:hypothetical protein n=1 Tax=Rhodopirellula europaea TaxID=1263866 RepID=UPI00058700F9|nr:hypothetical protein [Rhodopirellula europaea]
MLDWLKRVFTQTTDPFADLPHPCRVWLCVEIASIAIPLLSKHRPDVPKRQLIYLNAAHREIRKALVTPNPRLKRLRRIERNGIMFAGHAIRHGCPQVSTIPKLTGWAGAALLKGAESSQNCVDECASLAYDATVDFGSPEIWAAIMERANEIHHLAATHNWLDDSVLPDSLVLTHNSK